MSRLKNIYDQSKQAVVLGKLLGRGGEGAVFEVVGSPNLVAKIYHPEKAQEREQKIAAMIAADIQSRVPNAAFPISSLVDGAGAFAGFTMRRIGKQKPVHELYSPASRRNEFPNADYRLLLRTSLNIAKAVAAVHAAGCVIGDLNHSGILVGNDATATLIDCDSFQFSKDNKVYYCTVGVPDYTPPELQGKPFASTIRTQNHDAFGLAVAVFSLLFLGRHPFSGRYLGRGDMPEERTIAEYRFAYSSNRARTQTEPPPFAPTLSYIPGDCAAAFEACFGPVGSNNARPRAVDWVALLQKAETQLVKCGSSQAHFYFSSAPNCPWCTLEKAIPGFIAFPVPLVINTTAPVDLGQLIAAIRGVSDPGVAPILNVVMPAVPIVPNAQNKGVLDSSAGYFISSTLGGICASAILRLGYVQPIAALTALGISAYFALRNPKQQHANNPRSHQLKQTWDQIDRRYQVDGSNSRFNEAGRQAESHIREYNELPKEESRLLAELAAKQRDMQLKQFLERYTLVNATIKGIGSGKKATLRSYGISTAADVARQRIVQIPGFGPVTAGQLVSWRSELERRFTFNPNLPIDPRDIVRVKSGISQKRASLEAALKGDLITIRTSAAEIERARSELTNRARSIWVELKQAEADEKIRVFGDVTARRWVFGVSCVASFMVAGIGSGPTAAPTHAVAVLNQSAGTAVAVLKPPVEPLNKSPSVAIPSSPNGQTDVPRQPSVPVQPYLLEPKWQVASQQNSVFDTPALATVPPLGPPQEIRPVASPPTELQAGIPVVPTGPAAPDPVIIRLSELGFAPVSQAKWDDTTYAGLREFKIVNHLSADSRVDPLTTQTINSRQAIARNRSFLGGWGVDPSCSQGAQLTISAREARTDGGVCSFEAFLPNRTGWMVRGHCQVGPDRWPATITLGVSGKELSWSSAKGKSTYFRCG